MTMTMGSTSPGALQQDSQTNGSTQPETANGANSTSNGMTEDTFVIEDPTTLAHLSTAILTSKLSSLQSTSTNLSSTLTAKLASSPSLLHIGPSLSTLPPDLQTMMETLQPIRKEMSQFQSGLEEEHERVNGMIELVETEWRRHFEGKEGRLLFKDLVAVEKLILGKTYNGDNGSTDEERKGEGREDVDEEEQEMEYVTSLERAAHTCLHLLEEVQIASKQITATTTTGESKHADNTTSSSFSSEKAQFLMRLSLRAHRLESETIKRLKNKLEDILNQRIAMDQKRASATTNNNIALDEVESKEDSQTAHEESEKEAEKEEFLMQQKRERQTLQIGHILRSLTLLSKNAEAESTFATVAIMPILRSNLSIGKLDEGGNRGECTGLGKWLQDVVVKIWERWGDVLSLNEGMFGDCGVVGNDGISDVWGGKAVDLVCGGVWVPMATALMTDPVIRMAIFSPGIASVLQANYVALDKFLSELASNLLKSKLPSTTNNTSSIDNELYLVGGVGSDNEDEMLLSQYYYQPSITSQTIATAQSRLYSHPMMNEFSKKWNLPIYYQLRFGEACSRLDEAIKTVTRNGWLAEIASNSDSSQTTLESRYELPLFAEVYSIFTWLWGTDVFLRPLTHRFSRGAIQLLGRLLAFIQEGLDGKIKFGNMDTTDGSPDSHMNGDATHLNVSYYWKDRIEDVAAVSWDLATLHSCLCQDYLDIIQSRLSPKKEGDCNNDNDASSEELSSLISDVFADASQEITPIISQIWNDIIVDILIAKCSGPLSAVKGVAATYRMTNRPPPVHASPFVATILRPLNEFNTSIGTKIPDQVGVAWKERVVKIVAERYSAAVQDLIETVQRTEEALKNRKAKRMNAGGMSDGEKVKLQLFLDQMEFVKCVENGGVNPSGIEGVEKLLKLTESAEDLYLKTRP